MAKPPKCPRCGGRKRYTGYGFAAGAALGGYTFCRAKRCGRLLELHPDLDDLDDALVAEITAAVEARMKLEAERDTERR